MAWVSQARYFCSESTWSGWTKTAWFATVRFAPAADSLWSSKSSTRGSVGPIDSCWNCVIARVIWCAEPLILSVRTPSPSSAASTFSSRSANWTKTRHRSSRSKLRTNSTSRASLAPPVRVARASSSLLAAPRHAKSAQSTTWCARTAAAHLPTTHSSRSAAARTASSGPPCPQQDKIARGPPTVVVGSRSPRFAGGFFGFFEGRRALVVVASTPHEGSPPADCCSAWIASMNRSDRTRPRNSLLSARSS
mmetsp:Transcript_13798/g.55208  ORF Transcript_13798/g.55208 Transcript_13798/m.55208 type:complete len:250 (+) Transcript_13798:146-895(+)